jgi:hypothetical protein
VLKPHLHPLLRLLRKVVKVLKNPSIFSRPQPQPVEEDAVQPLVEEQEVSSEQEEQLRQLLQPVVGWATSTSSATTPNSNNSAKSCNNNPKCSSLSSNKSALVTHNWHS